MITPPKDEFYSIDMFDHDPSRVSLDRIATEVYGRLYKGQQTGDMIRNDSYIVYDMDEDYVDECLANLYPVPARTYLGLKPRPAAPEGRNWEPIYAEGVGPLDYWLSLKLGDDGFKYDFEIARAAPTPDLILADLISKGHLPYGKYLVQVSW